MKKLQFDTGADFDAFFLPRVEPLLPLLIPSKLNFVRIGDRR